MPEGAFINGPLITRKGFQVGPNKRGGVTMIDEDAFLYQKGMKITASAAELNTLAAVAKMVTVTLTNAEIKALLAAPKELVAAPGAGKFIEFLAATLFHDYCANVLTGNHDMTIGLNNGTVAVAAVIGFADFPLKAADHVYSVKAALAFNGTAASAVNKNLALAAAGNFAGNAGNDTIWKIKVAYLVHDFN